MDDGQTMSLFECQTLNHFLQCFKHAVKYMTDQVNSVSDLAGSRWVQFPVTESAQTYHAAGMLYEPPEIMNTCCV